MIKNPRAKQKVTCLKSYSKEGHPYSEGTKGDITRIDGISFDGSLFKSPDGRYHLTRYYRLYRKGDEKH